MIRGQIQFLSDGNQEQSEIDQFERAMSGTGNWIAMIMMITAFLALIHLAFTQAGFYLPSCVLPGNWKHNLGITTDYRNMIMMPVMMSVLTEERWQIVTWTFPSRERWNGDVIDGERFEEVTYISWFGFLLDKITNEISFYLNCFSFSCSLIGELVGLE